jgi:hypothetical protein
MITALYAESAGTYFDLHDVDAWDEPRDARRYSGLRPVVAHPPCQRWGRYFTARRASRTSTALARMADVSPPR